MKKLKFNAWCYDTHKMYYDIQDNDYSSILLKSKYTILQDTQLIDRNNNRIFVGDVIGIYNESFKKIISKIIILHNSSLLFYNDSNSSNRVQILGNIYEYDELKKII